MEEILKGKIEQVLENGEMSVSTKDGKVTIQPDNVYLKDLKNASNVVVVKSEGPDGPFFQIVDHYRLDSLWPMLLLFFGVIVLLCKGRGLGSILGLLISVGVIFGYIVPRLLAGENPILISIAGCLAIALTTMYPAHGLSKKTTIAIFSTLLTLTITGLISILMVGISRLTGLGQEEAATLLIGPTAQINFKGLLLGGILIGTLGVLDDVTTSLSSTIFEVAKANPAYTVGQLFNAGLEVGREHVTSLVNTLVMAYAGSSLPVFLIAVINPNNYPLWSILNSELIMEEIVRTLAGSMGLVMAVPITTYLAARFAKK